MKIAGVAGEGMDAAIGSEALSAGPAGLACRRDPRGAAEARGVIRSAVAARSSIRRDIMISGIVGLEPA